MCSGMVFTTSGMLTKQMLVQQKVWECCRWVQKCYRWIGKAWDGFRFGQGLFRWCLDLVFQGPVATSEKNWQLNRTTTDLD